MSSPSTISPEKNVKFGKFKDLLRDSLSFSRIDPYFESSFDTTSQTEISQDDLTIELKRRKMPINLKLIQENVNLKKKVDSLSKIPDIGTLNNSNQDNSTQTTDNQQVEKMNQMDKAISQFRLEKEKFQEFYLKEKQNNLELVKLLDAFKAKTEDLEKNYSDLNQKLENSLNSQKLHTQQSQQLSSKCVQYSNELIIANQRLNELNQELKDSREKVDNYKESLELFTFQNGNLKEMILRERQDKESQIIQLNERITSLIQISLVEKVKQPLQAEDQFLMVKLEEKIEFLKEDADKERKSRQQIVLEYEKTLKELEVAKKQGFYDKKEGKKLHERLDQNKEEFSSLQNTIFELQNSSLKREQDYYLLDQKLKNMQGQIHAKDLIIKDQNKKNEAMWIELEGFKSKNDALSQRQSTILNLKRDLARKDDLLKTYKNKLECLSKELSETKTFLKEPQRKNIRRPVLKTLDNNEPMDSIKSEKKYTQLVGVLGGLLVKVQPSPHEWKSNDQLRNRMTCISTKYLGKDLDSLMKYPDYPSQLLDILSQDHFETDLHAFLKDILCGV